MSGSDDVPKRTPAFVAHIMKRSKGMTYKLVLDPRALDGVAIVCLKCGRTSYLRADVQYKYCGDCDLFHED